MRKFGFVLASMITAAILSGQAHAAPLWYVVFECNIRSNIATKPLNVTDKRYAWTYEMDRCLAEFYPM